MNARLEKVLTALGRAHTGPVCDVQDWDARVIPQKTRAYLKKYHLEKTCDPAQPINADDSLADTFYRAGYELALDIGMLCPDTDRVIKVTEEEIEQTLKELPDQLVLGSGPDTVVMKPRRPEDPYPPITAVPLCLVVSEHLWVPLVVGLVQKRHLVDIFFGPSLPTVYGLTVRGRAPRTRRWSAATRSSCEAKPCIAWGARACRRSAAPAG